jgi:hypothetical protein
MSAGDGAEDDGEMTDSDQFPMAGLDLDTAIRLRWALRDIKGRRIKLSPVSPEDLRTLIEMGLIEMRDDLPALTGDGDRAINGADRFLGISESRNFLEEARSCRRSKPWRSLNIGKRSVSVDITVA